MPARCLGIRGHLKTRTFPRFFKRGWVWCAVATPGLEPGLAPLILTVVTGQKGRLVWASVGHAVCSFS